MYAMSNPERKYLGTRKPQFNAEAREVHAGSMDISKIQTVDMTCVKELRTKTRSLKIAMNY